MNPELKQLLIITSITLPVGLFIGLFLRKQNPEWSKAYTKSCLDKKWWIFLIGLILFTGFSMASFLGGRVYFGWFFTAFALLEAFCLVKYGFRPLSPEMETKIDANDPTRLFTEKSPGQGRE